MRFIKGYNEGLFSSKKEIPVDIIDDLEKSLSGYSIEVIRDDQPQQIKVGTSTVGVKSPLDRYEILIKEKGEGSLYWIKLPSGDGHISKDKSYIKLIIDLYEERTFKGNHISLNFYYYLNGNYNYVNRYSLSQFIDAKFNYKDVIDAISILFKSSEGNLEREKKRNDFFERVTEGEIIDLISDISDEIGVFTIEKSKWNKSYSVSFVIPDIGVFVDEEYSICVTPSELFTKIVSEIWTLSNRLKSGYNLKINYSFYGVYDGEESTNDNRTLYINIYEE